MPNSEKAKRILRAVYDELRDHEILTYEEKREDFVFHIIECLDDIDSLLKLLRNANESAKVAARQIIGFLYHVTPHLNAASKLLLDGVPDTFSETNRSAAELDAKPK